MVFFHPFPFYVSALPLLHATRNICSFFSFCFCLIENKFGKCFHSKFYLWLLMLPTSVPINCYSTNLLFYFNFCYFNFCNSQLCQYLIAITILLKFDKYKPFKIVAVFAVAYYYVFCPSTIDKTTIPYIQTLCVLLLL